MTSPFLAVKASGLGGRGYRAIFEEGQPTVPSVTTALGVLDKGGVTQWAVDNTAAYAVANLDALYGRSEEQGFNYLRWYHRRTPDVDSPDINIHNYHEGVLNDAADNGTWAHEFIEADLTGGFEPTPQNALHEQMAEAYLLWKMDHDVSVHAVETTVYGNGYAGTLDQFWTVDGITYLNDNKTSRAVRDEHMAQLGALGAAHTMAVEVDADNDREDKVEYKGRFFVPEPLPAFSGYSVLQVRPDDYDSKGNFVPAFCELHVIPNPVVDAAFELFQGALSARLGQRALKYAKKEAGIG